MLTENRNCDFWKNILIQFLKKYWKYSRNYLFFWKKNTNFFLEFLLIIHGILLEFWYILWYILWYFWYILLTFLLQQKSHFIPWISLKYSFSKKIYLEYFIYSRYYTWYYTGIWGVSNDLLPKSGCKLLIFEVKNDFVGW